jgi:murein L,D-transpeptidase YafK
VNNHYLACSFFILLSLSCGKVFACDLDKTYIEVNTSSKILVLCENNKTFKSYKVSLGKNGVGKSKQGDLKTPIGSYSLGIPRPSNLFHTFIPVGYPTAQQASAGDTGGDIGVHGPKKTWAWLGHLTTAINWTQGCIALGTNEEIDEIADWIKKNNVNSVIVK